MNDERYLISYLGKLETPGFFPEKVKHSWIPEVAVTDAPLTDFMVYMRARKYTSVIPLFVQRINLTEAVELVSGGGGVQAHFIEEEL